MSDQDLTDLAAAVTDGEIVDWPAAKSRLNSSRDHSVAQGLHALSKLSVGIESSTFIGPRQGRLPWLLEAIRPIAIGVSALGAVGMALSLRSSGSSYVALLLVTLTAFVAAASFLDAWAFDRRARALAACYWTTAAAFAMRGISWYTTRWPDASWTHVLAAIRPESFLAASLWQFAREFPVVTRFSTVDSVCAIALRSTLVAGTVLFVVNLLPVIGTPAAIAQWVAPLQRATGYDPWFWNVVFCSTLPALVVIGWRGRAARGTEQSRVRIFLYTIAFSLGPVAVEVLAEGALTQYAAFIHTPSGRWWGGWLIYPPLIALPGVTAYAVLVNDVLRVRVAIQQGLRYLLAKSLIAWGAAVPLAMSILYVYRHREQPIAIVFDSSSAHTLMWLDAIAILALVCRPFLLRLFDRWARPEAGDPSQTFAQMADGMKHTRTPLEVTALFARAAERALQAPAEAYLVRDGRLLPIRDSDSGQYRQSLIPVLLEGCREPCVVSPHHRQSYYSLMSEHDRQWIDDNEICVVVPVVPGRNRRGLAGIVALKNRRDALAFSNADLRFLRAGAASAGMALDVLEAATPHTAADVGTDADELARQCRRCSTVEPWRSDDRPCVCGGTWEPAALPKRFADDLEVTAKLGAGGMGTVYRAADLTLGRDVAIKTLPRLSDAAAARLTREAKTMAGLEHPNIAVLYAARIWRGTPVLIMEHLAGGTLARRLGERPLLPAEALAMARALTGALVHVHACGLFHGDIKPSNIGFTAGGVPKFLDFGLARAVTPPSDPASAGAVRDGSGSLAGTFAYLSPEVREGEASGPALDTWAMAVVLCESLLGKHPHLHARTRAEIASGVAGAVDVLQPVAGVALCDFLSRALSVAPNRQLRTATDLLKELTALERIAGV